MAFIAGLAVLSLTGWLQEGWDVEIRASQESSQRAEVIEFADNKVVIRQGDRTTERPFDSLLSLKFVDRQSSRLSAAFRLRLIDGSLLGCDSVASDGEQLTAELGDQRLRFATRHVFTLQLRQLGEEQQAVFDNIAESAATSDTLIVQQDAENLTRIEGIVNSIEADSVDFEFSGTSVAVPFTKLAGIRFFSSVDRELARVAAIVRDTLGNSWFVSSLSSSEGGEIAIELSCGARVEMPIDRLAEIDFSLGSTKYLAEMDPLRLDAVARFDFPVDLRLDQVLGAFSEEPVQIPGKSIGPSVKFVGSGRATYVIPEGFTRLLGAVELRPPGERFTPCRVQVYLEGKLLWEEQLTEPQSPVDFELDVVGNSRLQLVVSAISSLATGDVVVWREARLLK